MTTKTQIICDGCGVDCDTTNSRIVVFVGYEKIDGSGDYSPVKGFPKDFCDKCAIRVIDGINK